MSVLEGCAESPLTPSHQVYVVAVRTAHCQEALQVEADIRVLGEVPVQKRQEGEDILQDCATQVVG